MSEFREKHDWVVRMENKIRDAPRSGWVKPGSRAKANEAITISRKEAEKMAFCASSYLYSGYSYLYEMLALIRIFEGLAKGEEDAATCRRCHNTYRVSWGVGCPYCKAEKTAHEQVDYELSEKIEGAGE